MALGLDEAAEAFLVHDVVVLGLDEAVEAFLVHDVVVLGLDEAVEAFLVHDAAAYVVAAHAVTNERWHLQAS